MTDISCNANDNGHQVIHVKILQHKSEHTFYVLIYQSWFFLAKIKSRGYLTLISGGSRMWGRGGGGAPIHPSQACDGCVTQ